MIKIKKKYIAIFASGAGSNAAKIIDYFKNHDSISVALIVCNNPKAGVIQVASNAHIPVVIIEKKQFLEHGYVDLLRRYDIDLIVLAGFLWKIPAVLIKEFKNRIINIHPALLPAYGGKGMFGMAVHNAIINAGERNSGITIHFVDEEYDHGATILQKTIDLDTDETAASLAEKIHALEHRYLAPLIENILSGKLFENETPPGKS